VGRGENAPPVSKRGKGKGEVNHFLAQGERGGERGGERESDFSGGEERGKGDLSPLLPVGEKRRGGKRSLGKREEDNSSLASKEERGEKKEELLFLRREGKKEKDENGGFLGGGGGGFLFGGGGGGAGGVSGQGNGRKGGQLLHLTMGGKKVNPLGEGRGFKPPLNRVKGGWERQEKKRVFLPQKVRNLSS